MYESGYCRKEKLPLIATSASTRRIRMKLGFTREYGRARTCRGQKEEVEGERTRWKIPICCRDPAGSISSSVVPFGFLDDITLGDGNNARFDRAFVDE